MKKRTNYRLVIHADSWNRHRNCRTMRAVRKLVRTAVEHGCDFSLWRETVTRRKHTTERLSRSIGERVQMFPSLKAEFRKSTLERERSEPCPDAYRNGICFSEEMEERLFEDPCTTPRRRFSLSGCSVVWCRTCLKHHNSCIDSANGIPGPRVPHVKWSEGQKL